MEQYMEQYMASDQQFLLQVQFVPGVSQMHW
jgi:hypothetical protein